MDAKVIDIRDGSTVGIYRDWPYPVPDLPDSAQFGCVRAEHAADKLNANEPESDARFVVERVLPQVGHPCRIKTYGRYRRGRIIAVRNPKNRRTKVRVRWHSKKGVTHEHWYSTLDLRRAEVFPTDTRRS